MCRGAGAAATAVAEVAVCEVSCLSTLLFTAAGAQLLCVCQFVCVVQRLRRLLQPASTLFLLVISWACFPAVCTRPTCCAHRSMVSPSDALLTGGLQHFMATASVDTPHERQLLLLLQPITFNCLEALVLVTSFLGSGRGQGQEVLCACARVCSAHTDTPGRIESID